MKRLLWKEWNEVKWYLLLLAAVPIVTSMLMLVTDGFGWHLSNGRMSEAMGLVYVIVVLIIYVWAASRIENGSALDWMPVGAWKVWFVKFIPGLAAAALLPLWIHLLLAMVVGPFIAGDNLTARELVLYTQYTLAAYTVSFAAAMLLPFALAVVAAVAVTYISIASESGVASDVTPWTLDNALVQIILIAVAVSVVLWLRPRHEDIRRKRAVAAVTALVVYALAGPTFYIQVYRDLLNWRPSYSGCSIPVYDAPEALLDNRHASVAYIPRDRAGQGLDVKVNGRTTVLVRAGYAAPLAWLPSGNLVFAVPGNDCKAVNISEWNCKSSKMTSLASLPAPGRGKFEFIARAVPDAEGSRIAVFSNSLYGGNGRDLWMIDRRIGSAKLVYPGMLGTGVAWSGDRLVVRRGDEYWSIRDDGRDLRPVLEKRRWRQ